MFTVEESNLLSIYSHVSRGAAIATLRDGLADVSDTDMLALMKAVIAKLEVISDGEYTQTAVYAAEDLDGQEQ